VQFAYNQRFRANRLYRYVLVSESKVIQNHRNYEIITEKIYAILRKFKENIWWFNCK